MIHGFNIEDDLVCEGVIGDGCGGGRLFIVQDERLQAYDPQTQSYIVLLEDVLNAVKISKSACLIKIICKDEIICFDLSKLQTVS
ncbi:thiamine biosynthesis protein ThiF [Sulfurimonas sp.]|uniref:thiamine biosynthesis protein ThiF n=1 Tax=Sulfurimonas sp. TaxID=2022749 RepID=UPI0026168403|nr:thiamine biosynthesis protein ThiF [Sulfurimonas sp.]